MSRSVGTLSESMDRLVTPEGGGQLICGMVERPGKAVASLAGKKRKEIQMLACVSSSDNLGEPPAKHLEIKKHFQSSLKEDPSLGLTCEKTASDASSNYGVRSSKPKGFEEEACGESSVENDWISEFGADGNLKCIRKSEILKRVTVDRNGQSSNSCTSMVSEAADDAASSSRVCVHKKPYVRYSGTSDPTEGESRALGVASKPGQEGPPHLLAGSSSRTTAGAPAAAMVCNPDASTCGCVSGLSNPTHGFVSICGRRREMEDAISIVPSFLSLPSALVGSCLYKESREPGAMCNLHFYGVYDGHEGNQASSYCKDHLHRALVDEFRALMHMTIIPTDTWDSQWQRAFEASFLRIDREIAGPIPEPAAPETVGSTAAVAVVGPCQIIVANCGDSRAVLSRNGQAIPLSIDHKPDREDEMARVEAAGGRVIFWNGHRVLGVLAMSRALGDRYLKPYVIANPEVTCTQRSEDDECLILASDGLWDVLSNEAACEISRRCLSSHRMRNSAASSFHSKETSYASPAATAAALLTKLALAKGSSDNISVVVIDLMNRSQ